MLVPRLTGPVFARLVASHRGTGSFDSVRLAPHWVQDDKEKKWAENTTGAGSYTSLGEAGIHESLYGRL